jgi:hypothetical protein
MLEHLFSTRWRTNMLDVLGWVSIKEKTFHLMQLEKKKGTQRERVFFGWDGEQNLEIGIRHVRCKETEWE